MAIGFGCFPVTITVTTGAQLASTYRTAPPGSGIMIANDISFASQELERDVRDTSAPNIRIWSNPDNVDTVHGPGYIRILSPPFSCLPMGDDPHQPHNTEFYNLVLEHGNNGGNNAGWINGTRKSYPVGEEIENVSWFNCIMDAVDTGHNAETNTPPDRDWETARG